MSRAVVGQYVCTSGAATGMHCGLRVERVRTGARPPGARLRIGYVMEAKATADTFQAHRGIAAGTGDSGGPVVSRMFGDAYGIISYISYIGAPNQTLCGAANGYATDDCGEVVGFVELEAILEAIRGGRNPVRLYRPADGADQVCEALRRVIGGSSG